MNYSKLSGFVAVIFGALYIFIASNMRSSLIGNPNEHKIFPYMLGAAMCILGVLQIIRTIKEPLMDEKYKRDKNEAIFITKIVLVCVGYVAIFKSLGYVLSTIIFLETVLFIYSGKEKLVRSTIVAVVFSVVVYVIFEHLLGIRLPKFDLL